MGNKAKKIALSIIAALTVACGDVEVDPMSSEHGGGDIVIDENGNECVEGVISVIVGGDDGIPDDLPGIGYDEPAAVPGECYEHEDVECYVYEQYGSVSVECWWDECDLPSEDKVRAGSVVELEILNPCF